MLGATINYLPWVVFAASPIALWPFFKRIGLNDNRTVLILAVVVVALVQGENIFLGPLSRHEFGDGEQLYFGYFPSLAKHSHELFLTQVAGGVDRYAFGRIGVELFSLRLEMARFMPLWAVLDFFRFAVPAVAFAGVWLFATRLLQAPREVAFAAASLYAVAFDYTATLTFLYGFDGAALPFLFFVLFGLRPNVAGISVLLVTIVVFVSAADPFYFWPIFLVVGGLILLWMRPQSWAMLLGGGALLSIMWLLNYAEAIFAFLMMLPYSARGLQAQNIGLIGNIAAELSRLGKFSIDYNRGTLSIAVPLALSVALALRARRHKYLLVILIPIAGELMTNFLTAIPWAQFKLNFLATFRWYIEYGADSLTLLVLCGAAALRAEGESALPKRFSVLTATVVGAVALAHVAYFRLQQAGQTLVRGNLSAFEQVLHLDPAAVGIKPGFRVVSLPSRVDPNLAAGAGLETYDAGATLIHRGLYKYWQSGIEKLPGGLTTAQAGFTSRPAYNECCEPLRIADYANIDMLRIANVGYILTYRALSDPQLQKVFGPAQQPMRSLLQQTFGPPAPIFVYEIRDPLPRAYAASGVDVVPDAAADIEVLDRVKQIGLARRVVVRAADARLTGANLTPGLAVTAKPVLNGYEIRLSQPTGALVVVNVPYYPWWHAVSADGALLQAAAANVVQTAIVVPPGVTDVQLMYKRPTLFGRFR